jgi:ZIP family zinc transporter
MNIWVILLSFATFCSTLCGGLFALKHKNQMHRVMAFAAGVLLGVVAFDIFPEIVEQLETHHFNTIEAMIALVVGFLLFHILEKSILLHHGHEENYPAHKHPHVGILSALALAGHSFLDGVGIGLGFQVNWITGIAVAIAVIGHDFTDGMNTVTLLLTNKNSDKRARNFLFLDAFTPVLGAASTLFFTLPPLFLLWYLGFFAGFLLYIGASDILPEAHSERSSYGLIGLTLAGVIFTFIVTRFA